ncbi:MAG: DUF5671 domain-containing protein [Dehalococcoidia bacterium]
MSTVRRVFFYILALAALGILATGLWNLLSLSFDAILARFTLAQIGDIKPKLSLGIAMVVIGGPLWYMFWGAIQRHAEREVDEAGSILRAFFLNIILIVSAFLISMTLEVLLNWMMSGFSSDQFSPGSTATLIVFAIIGCFYWRISEKEGYPTAVAKTVRRWYIYILSISGLIWLSFGLVQILNAAFISFPIWQGEVVRGSFWNSGMRSNIAWVLVGGLVWAFYWFYSARNDINSSLRQVYFYLLTILGGAIAGLVALTFTCYRILYWLLVGGRDAAGYFQLLGWAIPTILVAACVWYYHLRVAEEESTGEQRQLSARRVHYYLMSFLGLGTLIAGLIVILGIPLDWAISTLKSEAIVLEPDWLNNHLSLGIAMLAVSIPIWLLYWSRILDSTEKGGIDERSARSRRIYLYVIIGASVVMLAADLVNIVYQLLNGILTGNLGADTLRNTQWSLQTVFIAVPVLIYHLQIARQDQKLGSEVKVVRKNVTLLVNDKKSLLVSLVEQKLGYKVRTVQYAGETIGVSPVLSDEDIDRLVSQLKAAAASDIMLILLEGHSMVLPYK